MKLLSRSCRHPDLGTEYLGGDRVNSTEGHCPEMIMKKQKFTAEQMLVALKNNSGNISESARELGCSSALMYRRIKAAPDLLKAVGRIRGWRKEHCSAISGIKCVPEDYSQGRFSTNRMISALREAGGDIDTAAKGIGCSSKRFGERVYGDNRLRGALNVIRATDHTGRPQQRVYGERKR